MRKLTLIIIGAGTLLGNFAYAASNQFGDSASIASNFEVTGYASASLFQGVAFTTVGTCTGSANKITWAAGTFRCEPDVTGAGGGSGLLNFGISTIGSSFNKAFSLSFEPGAFNVNYNPTTKVASLSMDWVNGPASRSLANTWDKLQTFSLGASISTQLDTRDLIIQDTETTNDGRFKINSTNSAGGDKLSIYNGSNTEIFSMASLGYATINNQINIAGAWTQFQATQANVNLNFKTVAGSGTIVFSPNAIDTLVVDDVGASLSTNFETKGYASASKYFGASLSNCSTAVTWTNGLFGCNGTAFQPLASQLTTFAAYNTNGIFVQTSAGTYTGRSIAGTTNQLSCSSCDGVSGNPTFSLTNPLIVPGMASISSNLEVLGFASVSGAFNVKGNTTLTGTLTQTGLATFNASPLGLSVTNSASVSANFEATGYSSASKGFFKALIAGSPTASGSNVYQGEIVNNGTVSLNFAPTSLTKGTCFEIRNSAGGLVFMRVNAANALVINTIKCHP